MRILFVDDEAHGREVIASFMESQLGHQVTQCDSGDKALELFKKEPFPFVISDLIMPGISGIELLRELKKLPGARTTDVVLITAYGDMDTAITALREGAYDYLNKPVDLEELSAALGRIVEHQLLIKENYELTCHFEEKLAEATEETKSQLQSLRDAFAEVSGIGQVGVFSSEMKKVMELAARLAEDRDMPVLIEGETGTGKEVIARMIHFHNQEITSPFVPINCSAITANLFESELFGYEGGAFSGARSSGQMGKFALAGDGTIFLDEIGDMPLELQPKLLRVLQDREYFRVGGLKKKMLKARVICASNKNLEEMVDRGAFRRDLYYRLNTGRIFIPALTERREDIEPLAKMFLLRYADKMRRPVRSISPEAMQILLDYPWPGNIRELQNSIERVVLINEAPEVEPQHLEFLLKQPSGHAAVSHDPDINNDGVVISLPDEGVTLDQAQARIVAKVVAKFAGNKTRAASYLGITRSTLRSKLLVKG